MSDHQLSYARLIFYCQYLLSSSDKDFRFSPASDTYKMKSFAWHHSTICLRARRPRPYLDKKFTNHSPVRIILKIRLSPFYTRRGVEKIGKMIYNNISKN